MQITTKAPRKKLPTKAAQKKLVSKGLIDNIDRLAKQVAKGNRNEEETRRWVIDVLRSAFGYKDEQLETEMKVLGRRVDIAVKINEKVLMVIECKASNLKLTKAATLQAANYAATLGSEWALVTNGQRWLLNYVKPNSGKEPTIIDVIDVELLDEDGISKDDIECLYLLTEQALVSGETHNIFHFTHATSAPRLFEALISDKVASAVALNLKSTYKKETGVTIDEIDTVFVKELLILYTEALKEM